ncbi:MULTISPECIES: response regulator transcription factor [unclassified Streptomyces]|uniref:helix-turn-helix transcriptional regulator n=1 Tax=unclassified Streptomyces TaxID=2593676 RepID=UPI001CBB1AE4|nr:MULTISPECIES: response regulator transcription factor [unclassified Streptomyces]WPO70752.1 response regulator transcription factor [Streptomyces sp. KN37]
MSDTRISVAVHAADPLSRAGVISHLRHQPSVELVDRTEDPSQTPSQAHQNHSHGTAPAPERVAVMLVDRLDDPAGTELRRLARSAEQRVVLIASELREPELLAVVECGVRAILWRHQATPQKLLRAVHSAARGEGELPPDLINRLMTQLGRLRLSALDGSPSAAGALVPTLGMAPREVDVVRLIAEGLDTKQISEKLAYSERTVKNVLHALMTRLQLQNRAHAVAYALREGYI